MRHPSRWGLSSRDNKRIGHNVRSIRARILCGKNINMEQTKTNITLRVDNALVVELRKKKVNLSKLFEDAGNILVLGKDAYLNVSTDEIEYYEVTKR